MAMTKDELQTVMSVVGATLYQTEMAKASMATGRLGAAQEGASAKSATLMGRFRGMGAAAHPYIMALMAIVAAAGAAAVALKKLSDIAREFEREMTDLSTQTSYAATEMQGIESAILSIDSSLSQADLVGAIKPFAYAGWEAADAMAAWNVNVQAAEAYAMDAQASGDGLLKTMIAYGEPAERAAYVMDLLAAAAAGGTMEFGELARYIPRVAAQSRAAGADIEEMTAALQAISFYAGSAEEGAGGLTVMFRALATAGLDARVEQEGLLNVLRDLYEQTGGNRAKLQELLGSAEAVDAVVKLSTDDFAMLEKAMGDMANAGGTVAGALAKRRDSLDNSLQRIRKSINDVLIQGGQLVNQVGGVWVRSFVLAAQKVAEFMAKWRTEQAKTAKETGDMTDVMKERAGQIVDVMAAVAKGIIDVIRIIGLQVWHWYVLIGVLKLVVVGYYEIVYGYRWMMSQLRPNDQTRAAFKTAATSLQNAKDEFAANSAQGDKLWAWVWDDKWFNDQKAKIDTAAAAVKEMIKNAKLDTGDNGIATADVERPTGPITRGGFRPLAHTRDDQDRIMAERAATTAAVTTAVVRETSARNTTAAVQQAQLAIEEQRAALADAITESQREQLSMYMKASRQLQRVHETIQQIIGGRLDQGAQDAIKRLGTAGSASSQLVRSAARKSDSEITLKLSWAADTPEAARTAAMNWLLPTLRGAALGGGTPAI